MDAELFQQQLNMVSTRGQMAVDPNWQQNPEYRGPNGQAIRLQDIQAYKQLWGDDPKPTQGRNPIPVQPPFAPTPQNQVNHPLTMGDKNPPLDPYTGQRLANP